jgi:transporter family-2 protein
LTNHQALLPIALLMFVAGIGIPVMATLNAGLGRSLESPVAATVVLFGIGLVLVSGVLAFAGVPQASRFAAAPPQFYCGAALVVFYVLSITWAAPRIGLGNAIFFVLVGQLVAAATIDHFGLFGALKSTLTLKRALGIALMGAGVYLARKPV